MIKPEELKKFKIFKDLSDSEANIIGEKASKEVYHAGKYVFAEKSLATNLYLVVKGRIEIKMSSADDVPELTIDRVGPEEIFGWSSVTNPHTFTAAAWAAEKTEVIAIQGDVLLNYFKLNNQLGYKVMRQIANVISKRLRRLSLNLVKCMSSRQ